MTQHVDEVARAIVKARCRRMGAGATDDCLLDPDEIDDARAAMRAVVKQLREPSKGMVQAGYTCIQSTTDIWQAMLDAYAKESGLD